MRVVEFEADAAGVLYCPVMTPPDLPASGSRAAQTGPYAITFFTPQSCAPPSAVGPVDNATCHEPTDTVTTTANRAAREPDSQRGSFRLSPGVPVLPTISVTTTRIEAGYERVGFARRRRGRGYFLDDTAIAGRHAVNFHDLLVGAPGVSVTTDPDGRTYLVSSRPSEGGADCPASPAPSTTVEDGVGIERLPTIAAAARARTRAFVGSKCGQACVLYVVDGSVYGEGTPGDIDQYVKPNEIAAIEKYDSGEVPSDLRQDPTRCVTIVIWTKQYLTG